MNSTELHNLVFGKVNKLAKDKGYSLSDTKMEQNFCLGKIIPNPDNLPQEVVWTDIKDEKNKITFRHRFSNICASYRRDKIFAEVEYNLDEQGIPYIAETLTFGGRVGLSFLNSLLNFINIA